jgi:hypothetical protein
MSRQCDTILNQPLSGWVNWNEANFVPLTFGAKTHDTLTPLQVFHLKPNSSSD